MVVLSSVQMREVDRATIEECGTPGGALMAQAAAALEARLERDFPAALAGRIAILCGGGNNGGDGLVLARLLARRRVPVLVLLFAPAARLAGDAAAALAALSSPPIEVLDHAAWLAQRPALLACDLVVDALFGTGLVRPLTGWLRAVVADLNRDYRGPVLAVDVPSGLCADATGAAEAPDAPVLRARATVTFTAPKLGHFLSRHAACVGALSIAPIGSPEALVAASGALLRLATPADCAPFLAPRPRDAHKGNFGHVLVVAGSLGKSGAATLVGSAALRMGAGLVTVALPGSVLPLVAAALPELMTEPLPETPAGTLSAAATPALLDSLLRPATVLALGPGLTAHPDTAAFVRQLVAAARLPCVLDADGLNAFAHRRNELRLPGGVLTPHPGEMARLFDRSTAEVQSRRLYYVQRLAAETGAIAVLKGQFTLIADPDGAVFINPSGNPGMATAGAGDVLAGLLAGLLAQFPQAPRLLTAAAAVFLHGRAGDLAAARLGEMSLLASDLLAALPQALREVAAP
ncbi:MAG TPA: NAD(P)H-hydrate dehydratase [Terriglobales bacterium]|nr:NAD(P)H-hydrate dehydratase [Terriglobales bacterium]